MDWKLEVVQVPVSDVDRAKRFYGEQVGFAVDLDTRMGDEVRLVQLTPPGSGCSIHLSTGIHNMPPGMMEGLQIVVPDIEAARAELAQRGRGRGSGNRSGSTKARARRRVLSDGLGEAIGPRRKRSVAPLLVAL